jgi:DegV family protein with EDD domain
MCLPILQDNPFFMIVKVITDSVADVPHDEARGLNIAIVPAYIHFGGQVYRDGIDIDNEEFYRKLVSSSIHPTTAAPSPGDFAAAYEAAARDTSEIVSIHVTRKHSAVYQSALIGRESVKTPGCRIEVIDSQGLTMWQGFVVLAAAVAARAGCRIDQVVAVARHTIEQLHALALLDTVSYAVKGGRVSKAIAVIEALLHTKLLVTLSAGELKPVGFVRTQVKGSERLINFVRSIEKVDEVAIAYAANREDGQAVDNAIRQYLPSLHVKLVQLGSAVGVHAGPRALALIVRSAD